MMTTLHALAKALATTPAFVMLLAINIIFMAGVVYWVDKRQTAAQEMVGDIINRCLPRTP